MDTTLSQPRRSHWRAVWLLIFGIAIVVIACISYAYYTGIPLGLFGARVSGHNQGVTFVSLVSHGRGANGPCFDEGTGYCEDQGATGVRQTVGFLFRDQPSGLVTEGLYGCIEGNNLNGKFILTTTYSECRQKKANPYRYGFIATSGDFENSTPLIFCEGSGEVVSDMSACSGTARQLGYMTGSLRQTTTTSTAR